jgi:myo-inositol-1-phosphate synthase
VRCCKLALNHGLGGPITGASAYLMKSPPEQHPDPVARQMVEDFIEQYGGAPKLPGQKPAQAPAEAAPSETTIDT